MSKEVRAQFTAIKEDDSLSAEQKLVKMTDAYVFENPEVGRNTAFLRVCADQPQLPYHLPIGGK